MCVLAMELPAESRTVNQIDPRTTWDEHAYLLALIADNLSFQRYEQKGGKGKKPQPLERPKPKPKKKQVHIDATDEQIHSLLFAPRQKR